MLYHAVRLNFFKYLYVGEAEAATGGVGLQFY